jgi:hypothetical protein
MTDPLILVNVDLWPRELRGQFVPADDNLAVGVEVSIDVFERAICCFRVELLNQCGEHVARISD